MFEFIRLPSVIVNLPNICEVRFLDDVVVLHWQGGSRSVLTGDNAGVFLGVLEKRYGLMTDPAARYWKAEEEEEVEALA